MLETLDYTIRIGSTPTFIYFDLSLEIYIYTTFLPGKSEELEAWAGGAGWEGPLI